MTRSGRLARGLQIWIDHADADREAPPAALHLAAAEVPMVHRDGVARRVLLGKSAGLVSPVTAPLPITLIDFDLQSGAVIEESIPAGETAFAVIRSGDVDTAAGPAGSGTAVFAISANLRFAARTDARLTLFGGPPLRHAVISAGPFVASSEMQARALQARFGRRWHGSLTTFDQSELDRAFDQMRNTKDMRS